MGPNERLLEVMEVLKDLPLIKIQQILSKLPRDEQETVLELLDELHTRNTRDRAQNDFMAFVKAVWPSFIEGRHHKIMAKAFEDVANGTCKRLIINMPPRFSKSEFASYLLPAWFLGKYPHKQIIQASHTAELAVGFGRKVRNLVGSETYRNIFPNVELQTDSKAAGRWNTNFQGQYFAIGVGGAVTGKGADCAYFSCKVMTRSGVIPISEIKVGDEVYGYDHKTNQHVWTRVRAIATQYKPELVQIGELLVTPEHRAFTRSGYEEAAKIRDVAVSPVWDRVSASAQGTRSKLDPVWPSGTSEDLLFESLRATKNLYNRMSVREREVTSSGDMQSMLPIWEARGPDMQGMQKEFHTSKCRNTESLEAPRAHRKPFLWEGMLRDIPIEQTQTSTENDWHVQKMWFKNTQRESILLHGMLCHSQSEDYRLFGGMVETEAPNKTTRWRSLCILWKSKRAYSSPSYRSQRQEQHAGEFNNPVRPLPQPLSSSSVGTSADDLAELLQGEGFRVVDLQTDTGNFFLDKYLVHNCFILDDVHSEQEAAIGAYNPEVYDRVYEWYTSGPRQRLQPSGSLVIVMTRWSQRDLTAQVLKSAAMRNSEEWRVIEFPAIMPSGESLWPEFWSTKDLEALREELPNSKWMAQYQQSPTSDSGAIVKREWWQWWEEDEPPECEFIIQAWDTAHEIKKMNDFSACTTWGVWYNDEDRGNANIILLNSLKVRLEFPELKKRALQEYKDWSPDTCIIEKKAAGAPLIQEFRAMGIPVSEFSPGKGQDKISRTNGIADIFSSGKVWAPRTRWAEELIDEMAAFPAGEHDDLHDSAVLAMHRYRQGGYVKLPSDEPEPVEWFKSKRDRKYY